jgi:hypothetical protein
LNAEFAETAEIMFLGVLGDLGVHPPDTGGRNATSSPSRITASIFE